MKVTLSAAQRRIIDELAGEHDVNVETTNLAGTIAVEFVGSPLVANTILIGLGGAILQGAISWDGQGGTHGESRIGWQGEGR